VILDDIAKANKNFFGLLPRRGSKKAPWTCEVLSCGWVGCYYELMRCFYPVRDTDIAKLAGRIVRRWWSLHGLPYVTDVFRVELEVRLLDPVSWCS
jgi:hypothetical protein